MSPIDGLALIILFSVGYLWRLSLLRLVIYSTPFIAGNMIYTLRVPLNVGRIAAIATLALAALELSRRPHYLRLIQSKVLILLGMAALITFLGVLFALQSSETLDLWNQSPAIRALRASSRYLLFWLLPLAFAAQVRNSAEIRLLIRDFIKAGILYAALGLLQFGVGQFAGIDLFPVIRMNGDSLSLQAMVGGEAGRATSICGEPRYFSSFLTVWLVFTVATGSLAGFRLWQMRLLSLLFLGTNILTGSRTGLAQLGMILVLLTIVCFSARDRGSIRQTSEILLIASVGLVGIILIEGLAIRNRSGFGEDNMNDQVTIGSLSLPVEYQDQQAVLLLGKKPYLGITGYGAGLWQYQTDPYQSDGFRRYFFDQGVSAIDSTRQNITALAFFTDFGLIGVWLAFRFYRFSIWVPESRGGPALRRQFKPVVSLLLAATLIVADTDIYSNVMVFLVLMLWFQSSAEPRLRNRVTIQAVTAQPLHA